jgi:carbon-monoxide dehydrogenase iron sulfur subunit
MAQYISVNHSVCTGCRECEVVCSLYHFGECNPERAAIRIIRREREGLVEPLPLVCQQCEEALCIDACPTGALFRKGKGGSVTVDEEKCTGCRECIDACPAGCIFIDRKRDVAICCDLCGGQPQCVELCHSNCLTIADADADEGERVQILAKVLKERTGETL